jgi:hypothetical protein
MMVLSYQMGKKHYPIKYNLRSMGFFFFTALAMYFISLLYKDKLPNKVLEVVLNNVLFLIFFFLFYKLEYPNLKIIKNEVTSESGKQ